MHLLPSYTFYFYLWIKSSFPLYFTSQDLTKVAQAIFILKDRLVSPFIIIASISWIHKKYTQHGTSANTFEIDLKGRHNNLGIKNVHFIK